MRERRKRGRKKNVILFQLSQPEKKKVSKLEEQQLAPGWQFNETLSCAGKFAHFLLLNVDYICS